MARDQRRLAAICDQNAALITGGVAVHGMTLDHPLFAVVAG